MKRISLKTNPQGIRYAFLEYAALSSAKQAFREESKPRGNGTAKSSPFRMPDLPLSLFVIVCFLRFFRRRMRSVHHLRSPLHPRIAFERNRTRIERVDPMVGRVLVIARVEMEQEMTTDKSRRVFRFG